MADNYTVRDGVTSPLIIKAKGLGNDANGNPIVIPQSVPSDVTGNAYNDSNPASVSVQSRQVTLVDKSSTVSTSSTVISAVNVARRGFWIQNLDASNLLWMNFGTAATAGPGSICILPYEKYEIPIHMMPTTAIYLIGTVANQKFTAKEC